jgi:hypothetical protein
MKNLLIFLILAGSTLLIYNHGSIGVYQYGNFIQDSFRVEKIAGHSERSRPERSNNDDDTSTERHHSR